MCMRKMCLLVVGTLLVIFTVNVVAVVVVAVAVAVAAAAATEDDDDDDGILQFCMLIATAQDERW